jgi:hypothetical protein
MYGMLNQRMVSEPSPAESPEGRELTGDVGAVLADGASQSAD